MRIRIKFNGKNGNVPFSTQASVNSYIHDCLGRNNGFHDKASDYSLTSLQGGCINEARSGLRFEDDAFIIVSSQNADFMGRLIMGVMKHRQFAYGMTLSDIEHMEEDMHDGWNHLTTITPILLKRGYEQKGPQDYWKVGDEGYAEHLRSHLVNKLSKMDPTLDLNGLEIIVPERPFNRVKKIMVKNVPNFASNCWVSIKCSKKVATMVYHLGLGQSTGSGFGTVCLNSNRSKYYPAKGDRKEKMAHEQEIPA